jgi:hypothetical protein
MKKLDPREVGLNDNASSPAESARVSRKFYVGLSQRKIFIWMVIIALIVVAGGWFYIFRHHHSASPTYTLTVVPGAGTSSTDNALLYADQDGIFSYSFDTNAVKQLVSGSGSSSSFIHAQRIGDAAIGVEVTGNSTSSIYVIDLSSGTAEKKFDIASGTFVDSLDFLSPDEFAYAVAATATMPGGGPPPDDVFLFASGTVSHIGSIVATIPYGSMISHSPDGKHIFFANQIYDITAGTWRPISSGCFGNESVWLNNDIVVLKKDSDFGGSLCYYDTVSGVQTQVATSTEWFGVLGNRIIYTDASLQPANVFRIFAYNVVTQRDAVLIPNAELSRPFYDLNSLGKIIYQPMKPVVSCMESDCLGGVASGSLMAFDPKTGGSSPLLFEPPAPSESILF